MNFNELLEKYKANWPSYRVSINDISGDGFELAQKLFYSGASLVVPNVASERLSRIISELPGSVFRYKVVPQPTIHLEQVDLLVNFNKEEPNGHAAKQIFNVQSSKEQQSNKEVQLKEVSAKRGRPARKQPSE